MRYALRTVFSSAALLSAVLVASPAAAQNTGAALPGNPAPLPESYNPDASGIYKIGGDVRAPVVVSQVNPDFTQEARAKKISGDVKVGLIVDAQGLPQNVHVERGVGSGLDEKAVEAVRGYKFKPATKDGVAVPVKISIMVNFQIF